LPPASDVLRSRLGADRPRVAIILGSSLSGIAEAVEKPAVVGFRELPGFPRPSVSGHAGKVLIGRIAGVRAIVLKGRVHAYEAGDAAAMRPVIETLAEAGVECLILTNAAGSLLASAGPGSLMLVRDHINFAGMNPLIGEAGDHGFVPLTDAYDARMAEGLRDAARAEGIPLAEGVYMWFSGPSFETPAEIRAARVLGADAVGMSTVPEVILARRFGLRVAVVSLITNLAAGIEGASPSHAETKEQGERFSGDMRRLIVRFLKDHRQWLT
jgi:purine-nucleoside phosphorylase